MCTRQLGSVVRVAISTYNIAVVHFAAEASSIFRQDDAGSNWKDKSAAAKGNLHTGNDSPYENITAKMTSAMVHSKSKQKATRAMKISTKVGIMLKRISCKRL